MTALANRLADLHTDELSAPTPHPSSRLCLVGKAVPSLYVIRLHSGQQALFVNDAIETSARLDAKTSIAIKLLASSVAGISERESAWRQNV